MSSNNYFGFYGGGTSGGGGGATTVVTDAITMNGDGSSGNPIYSTSGLESVYLDGGGDSYSLSNYGMGKVFYISGSSNTFTFDTSSLNNPFIRIVNKQTDSSLTISYNPLLVANGVYYQNTNEEITEIPLNMVYDFIFDSESLKWICVQKTPIYYILLDMNSGIILSQNIIQGGFYYLYNSEPINGNCILNLDFSGNEIGQTYTIMNSTGNQVDFNINTEYPTLPNGTTINKIQLNETIELVAFNGFYYVTQVYSV